MIVDLNLRGRRVLVVGAGGEAEKRVGSLLDQGCEITVVGTPKGHPVSRRIAGLAEEGAVRLVRRTVGDAGLVAEMMPDIVISTTSSRGLNRMITGAARRERIIAYSSDDPEGSDFANLAVIRAAGGMVRVAVSTGGRSPAMSKEIRDRVEKALEGTVTDEDIDRIRVHDAIRRIVKSNAGGGEDGASGGPTGADARDTGGGGAAPSTGPAGNDNNNNSSNSSRRRRDLLYELFDDRQIARLIRSNRMDEAEARIVKRMGSPAK